MEYGIYPVNITNGEETICICPDNARKSIDGTMWICNDPQYSPSGIEPLQVLTYAEALELMKTPEWAGEESDIEP